MNTIFPKKKFFCKKIFQDIMGHLMNDIKLHYPSDYPESVIIMSLL